MKTPSAFTVSAILLILSCGASSTAWAQAAIGQNCDAITPAIIDAYANQINGVVQLAERDVATNGSNGEYAVAATYSRNYAQNALGFAQDAARFLRSATPAVTNYAEASTVKDSLRSVLETMPRAAHWAIVSAVYHDSDDARQAFEGSMDVIHRGHELFAEASRCYMAPYLTGEESPASETSGQAANISAPLLLHLTFDGVLKNLGSIAETPLLFVKEGDVAPDYVEGRFGQALHFASSSAVVLPFALDADEYPQVTVTAWIKQDPGARDTRAILESGAGGGLRFGINGGNVSLMPGGVSSGSDGRLPDNEWVFVAGVIDRKAAVARVHKNDSVYAIDGINTASKPPFTYPNLLDSTAERSAYLTIGAYSFYPWGGAARSMSIDDVRLYAGALSVDEVNAIRTGSTPGIGGSTTGRAGTNTDGIIDAANDGRPPLLPGGSGGGLFETNTDGIVDAANDGRPPLLPGGTIGAANDGLPPDLDGAFGDQDVGNDSETTTDTSNALPEVTFVPTGEPKYSGVAGYSGDSAGILDAESEFIHRIDWGVSGDRPCYVKMVGYNALSKMQGEYLSIDSNYGACELSDDSRRAVILPGEVLIGQIEVCSTGNSKRSLSGIRISGDRPKADGSTTVSPVVDRSERPNCAEWSTAQRCPDGTYGTGLVVHNDKYGDVRSIVGLQLICREIEVRRTAE